MEQDQTQLKLLPAPTGGWNARDPLHAMPEGDAVEMVNYWPDTANVTLRGGTGVYWQSSNTYTRGWNLFELSTSTSGNKYSHLFVMVSNTLGNTYKLYRIDLSAGTATDVSGAVAFISNEYFSTIFQGRLFAFSPGVDPWDITESGNATVTAWTGIATAASELTFGAPYKGRMYLVARNSRIIYYGGLLAITGATTAFDVSDALHRGGSVMAIASASQAGDSNQNLFVVISSQGEVLLYQGDYPGSSTWGLLGRYFVGEILGRNCTFTMGGELYIMSADGIYALNTLISNNRNGTEYVSLTDKIRNAWVEATTDWRSAAAQFAQSWKAVHAPYHKMLLVRGLKANGDTLYLAMNTITQAWTKFDNIEALRILALDDRIFLTSDTVTTGGAAVSELYKPSTSFNRDFHRASEFNLAYTASCRQGFSYLDDPAHAKHITSVKALFELTQEAGHVEGTRVLKMGMDYDFADADITNQMLLQDVSANSTVNYSLMHDVRAEGTAFSLIYNSQFGGGYKLNWNAFIVAYESGGFLS